MFSSAHRIVQRCVKCMRSVEFFRISTVIMTLYTNVLTTNLAGIVSCL